MKKNHLRYLYKARSFLCSYYFFGTLGWLLILQRYPFENVIPRYAG
jgi:hypothetical protein